jgi:hypothetical protein
VARRLFSNVRREFFSYSARGPGERDDGTLAPTAAAGSIAFAPHRRPSGPDLRWHSVAGHRWRGGYSRNSRCPWSPYSRGPGDFTQTIDGVRREFFSYSARGPGERDDGTLAPVERVEEAIFAIDARAIAVVHRLDRGHDDIGGEGDFLDAFNPTLTKPDEPLKHGEIVQGVGWVDKDYLGMSGIAASLGRRLSLQPAAGESCP